NDRHPRGLANGSDVVGRHYMGHNNSVLFAISTTPNPTVFQKTLGVNDFYFASKEWEYPMGCPGPDLARRRFQGDHLYARRVQDQGRREAGGPCAGLREGHREGAGVLRLGGSAAG